MIRFSAHAVATLLVRVAALLVAMLTLSSALTSLGTGGYAAWGLESAAFVVFSCLVALVLWGFAGAFARVLISRNTTPIDSALDAAGCLRLVFVAIGLFQTVTGIAQFAYGVVALAVGETRGLVPPGILMFLATAQIAMGLALIGGARRLVAAIGRWRGRGRAEPELL